MNFKMTNEIIIKTNALKNASEVHPAEKTNKKDVYGKNYSNKKPCQVKQAGRTLAN